MADITEVNGKQYTVRVEDGGKRLVLDEVCDKSGDGDWEPTEGVLYYAVDGDGDPVDFEWGEHASDIWRKNFHNIWPTKNLAKKAAEYMRRSNAVIRACLLVDPDFVPDWENRKAEKYSASYNARDGEWNIFPNYVVAVASAYVSTEDKAVQVCALLTKWGVR